MVGRLFSALAPPKTCQTHEKLTSDHNKRLLVSSPSAKLSPQIWESRVIGTWSCFCITPKLFPDLVDPTISLMLWGLMGAICPLTTFTQLGPPPPPTALQADTPPFPTWSS